MNAKGSHVGFVLSFVIFIVFLVFLYTAVEPQVRTQKDKDFVLNFLKTDLIENVSTSLISASLKVDESVFLDITYEPTSYPGCFSIKNIEDELNKSIKVKTSSDFIEGSASTSGEYVVIKASGPKTFFKLYYSETFAENTGDCSNILGDDQYELTNVNENSYVFETKIKELSKVDYEKMKASFNVPAGNEFQFVFEGEEKIVGGNLEEPETINIYAEEIPIQYVDSEIKIKQGFIIIKVW